MLPAMDLPDADDHKAKLLRALARLTACRRQVQDTRGDLQKRASAHLDATQTAIGVANEHLQAEPNALTYRYHRTQVTAAARLRGIALRAEGTRGETDR